MIDALKGMLATENLLERAALFSEFRENPHFIRFRALMRKVYRGNNEYTLLDEPEFAIENREIIKTWIACLDGPPFAIPLSGRRQDEIAEERARSEYRHL